LCVDRDRSKDFFDFLDVEILLALSIYCGEVKAPSISDCLRNVLHEWMEVRGKVKDLSRENRRLRRLYAECSSKLEEAVRLADTFKSLYELTANIVEVTLPIGSLTVKLRAPVVVVELLRKLMEIGVPTLPLVEKLRELGFEVEVR